MLFSFEFILNVDAIALFVLLTPIKKIIPKTNKRNNNVITETLSLENCRNSLIKKSIIVNYFVYNYLN